MKMKIWQTSTIVLFSIIEKQQKLNMRKFEKNIEGREQLMNVKQSEDKLPRDPFVIHCSQFSTVMH